MKSMKLLAVVELIVTIAIVGLGLVWLAGALTGKPAQEHDTPKQQPLSVKQVTYSPEELTAETNKHREEPLILDPALNGTAQLKCEDMAARRDFNHGDLESYWIMAGRRPHGLAENLARTNEAVEKVVDGWMTSPTHRANIVDTAWGHVGFGVCSFEDTTLIVQHLSD